MDLWGSHPAPMHTQRSTFCRFKFQLPISIPQSSEYYDLEVHFVVTLMTVQPFALMIFNKEKKLSKDQKKLLLVLFFSYTRLYSHVFLHVNVRKLIYCANGRGLNS